MLLLVSLMDSLPGGVMSRVRGLVPAPTDSTVMRAMMPLPDSAAPKSAPAPVKLPSVSTRSPETLPSSSKMEKSTVPAPVLRLTAIS